MWIPIVAGIWPLVSARNAEFMANEVPGVVVPHSVIERMQRASAKSKEAGLEEGIAIAREMLDRVRGHVQGVQVSAPFGKVAFALQVFRGIPGIDADVLEEPARRATRSASCRRSPLPPGKRCSRPHEEADPRSLPAV